MKASAWITLVLILLILAVFNSVSHMWGTGIEDNSPHHHLEQSMFALRDWSMWIGFFLTALLLYLERQGSSIGRYWVLYPIFRVVFDVGWMMYAGNPYPSWYVQDLGAFVICMPLMLVIDNIGIQHVQAAAPVADPNERIKLWISIISLLTALIGLLRNLFA